MTKFDIAKFSEPFTPVLAATTLPIDVQGQEIFFDTYACQGDSENEQLLVLVHRDSSHPDDAVPLVRVHSGCVTGDIFHSLRCDCYEQLQSALIEISAAPLGALVYLPYHEGRGIGLFKKLQAYALQDRSADTVDANIEIGTPLDARDYSLTAGVLIALGMKKIRLLSNNPAKQKALADLGIYIVSRLPLAATPSPYNRRYLETKRSRLAHEF